MTTQHTPALPMHVEQRMAEVTRAHMRASRYNLADYVHAVSWIRVQCDHEFVSVQDWVAHDLDAYLSECNAATQQALGFDMLRICHSTRTRTFVAWTPEYVAHMAAKVEEQRA